MRRAAHDPILRLLVIVFGLDTVATMTLALTGVTAHADAGSGKQHIQGWLGLLWFVLLAAVLWRGARHVRQLRGLLGARDEQIEVAAATSYDWLWESDARMLATYCSPTVSAMLGRQPGDIVGHSLFEFICDDDRARLHDITEEAIRTGTGWRDVEARWKHAGGHLVTIQGSALPVHNERGAFIGFRGTRRLLEPDTLGLQRLTAIADRVERCIDGTGLTIALQPIIAIDGTWTGVEALSRFDDGRPPDVWFTEAGEAGLQTDLELHAARHALNCAADLPPYVTLSFNASPALILDPRLPTLLAETGLSLHRLVLELTEHSQIAYYDEIATVLAPLRAHGLQLAVDDAGAGYASFAHVLKLRPDVIKLDRSLIANIDADPARRSFVTAIVLLALELDATLTGEGVETIAELTTLAALGIDHAQGYLLARPTTDRRAWQQWASTRWPTPDRSRGTTPRPAAADTPRTTRSSRA